MPHDLLVRSPQRLRPSGAISAVLAARHHRAGRLVVVHGRDRPDDGPARVAVIASRKVGTAVRRNRAKRLLREAARSVRWRPDVDVVLIARHRAADAHVRDVEAEVRDLADGLGLLEGPA